MSLDIDWSLLCIPSLSAGLVESLNKNLASAPRPSFIGPIQVTALDVGTVGPDVEIRDIRDVWRAFDEGDDEGDDEDGTESQTRDPGDGYYEADRRAMMTMSPDVEDEDEYDMISPSEAGRQGHDDEEDDGPDMEGVGRRIMLGGGVMGARQKAFDEMSVYSGVGSALGSPRNSVVAVGMGLAGGLGNVLGGGLGGGGSVGIGGGGSMLGFGMRSPSVMSPGIAQYQQQQRQRSNYRGPQHRQLHEQHGNHLGSQHQPRSYPGKRSHQARRSSKPLTSTTHRQAMSMPPSPPAHPNGLPRSSTGANAKSSNSVPSLQLHLRIQHASDLQLTLLTSLSINYPSPSFMSLPLKLSITGWTLNADIVLAYSGDKHRVHITVLDEDDSQSAGANNGHGGLGGTGSGSASGGMAGKSIGERLLPNLNIESEIGHADAHILRNVGKVERFIVDVLRKTIVDELVFPNFHTIAL